MNLVYYPPDLGVRLSRDRVGRWIVYNTLTGHGVFPPEDFPRITCEWATEEEAWDALRTWQEWVRTRKVVSFPLKKKDVTAKKVRWKAVRFHPSFPEIKRGKNAEGDDVLGVRGYVSEACPGLCVHPSVRWEDGELTTYRGERGSLRWIVSQISTGLNVMGFAQWKDAPGAGTKEFAQRWALVLGPQAPWVLLRKEDVTSDFCRRLRTVLQDAGLLEEV